MIFICLIMVSCVGMKDDQGIVFWIYKTKLDYSNKVSVKLASDKSKISAAPGPHDIDTSSIWPKKLLNGYLLNGIVGGINTAFLSIDKKENDYRMLYL